MIISQRMTTGRESDVLYGVAVLYRKWILNRIKSSNKCLRLCSHCMTILGNDTTHHVSTYCAGNPVIGPQVIRGRTARGCPLGTCCTKLSTVCRPPGPPSPMVIKHCKRPRQEPPSTPESRALHAQHQQESRRRARASQLL